MPEDDDAYRQSGLADSNAAYLRGGEAKDNALYHHGGVAKDNATCRRTSAADNDTRGSTRKKPLFQIASGPILISPIHSNSSKYDPCKICLKKNDHFLTCGAAKVHIFVY